MRIRKMFGAVVCGTLGLLGTAQAQQQPEVVRPARPGVQVQVPGVGVQVGGRPVVGQGAQLAPGQVNDHALATCLAVENQVEVAIARFAGEKASSKEVKDFAGMMVRDHQALLQKLQQFAPEAAREGYLQEVTTPNQARRTTESPRNAVGDKAQPAGNVVKTTKGAIQPVAATEQDAPAQAGQSIDFLQLHRELAQECLSESKSTLEKKDGKQFDECFIGFQIARHAAMKDKLTVFERHASPELNKVLAEGLETTTSHLKKAEQIMKNLASASETKSASNSKD